MSWWESSALIRSDEETNLDTARARKESLSARGLLSHTDAAAENDWERIKYKMDGLRQDKNPVVFYMGSEAVYRKELCAALLVQPPKVWFGFVRA